MTFTDDLITQLTTLPDVASIDIQTEIQWFMRPYLLDFLIEAHAAFSLLPETLFLAVNILDRYCSKRVVYRRHYQLVGCTALLIAAKYGECAKKVPHIRELANMCCQLYDEDMFVQMEKHVIVTLEWLVGAPTADSFLEIILDDGMCDAEMEHLARYILEIAMFHKEFVSKRPSDMAKASLALSRVILNRPSSYSRLVGNGVRFSNTRLAFATTSSTITDLDTKVQVTSPITCLNGVGDFPCPSREHLKTLCSTANPSW